jgi:hypothetical protein
VLARASESEFIPVTCFAYDVVAAASVVVVVVIVSAAEAAVEM